jgi:hypothetical protein
VQAETGSCKSVVFVVGGPQVNTNTRKSERKAVSTTKNKRTSRREWRGREKPRRTVGGCRREKDKEANFPKVTSFWSRIFKVERHKANTDSKKSERVAVSTKKNKMCKGRERKGVRRKPWRGSGECRREKIKKTIFEIRRGRRSRAGR